MSLLSHEKNKQRKEKFFDRLNELISEYPEIISPYEDEDDDDHDEDCDFDPNSPKVVTGMVLLITTNDLNNYETLFFEKPLEQSHFHTVGMVKAASDRIL